MANLKKLSPTLSPFVKHGDPTQKNADDGGLKKRETSMDTGKTLRLKLPFLSHKYLTVIAC
jgi:hypothetical protein